MECCGNRSGVLRPTPLKCSQQPRIQEFVMGGGGGGCSPLTAIYQNWGGGGGGGGGVAVGKLNEPIRHAFSTKTQGTSRHLPCRAPPLR